MECRRINTMLITIGCSKKTAEERKKNQYIQVINCNLGPKTLQLGNIFRILCDIGSFYGVVAEDSKVYWYSISSTQTFLGSYPLIANKEYTNILDGVFNLDQRTYKKEANTTEIDNNTNNTPITNTNCILILKDTILIECNSYINIYGINGKYINRIPIGIDKVLSMHTLPTNDYVLVQLESDTILLYNTTDNRILYQKRHSPGTIRVIGSIPEYSMIITQTENGIKIQRLLDTQVLLSLVFPSRILSVAMDILQRKLSIADINGKIYHIRLDGEQIEDQNNLIVPDKNIKELEYSVCGNLLYCHTNRAIYTISLKENSIVGTLPLPEHSRYKYTRITSANAHLE
ncbi:hypothetical protein NEOKW01_0829 [Nematocida sp. AWRm80]|nr:hypothetical protein NEOKW01_0829 [Nematocida sp. AWRm80]